jgi:hypothetical protein
VGIVGGLGALVLGLLAAEDALSPLAVAALHRARR